MAESATRPAKQELIAGYKAILRAYIDQRPSGMRLRIARVLGTHKSFVSQITNPADPTPLPAKHINAIIEVCHMSPRERATFLAAYGAAHPNQSSGLRLAPTADSRLKTLQLEVPRLDDPARQKAMEDLVRDFARRVAEIMRDK